jgi:cyclopropane fatty-acyl-phospholipid synthase-like methyltransferase
VGHVWVAELCATPARQRLPCRLLITSDIDSLRIHYAETLHARRSNFLAKRKVIRLFEEDSILKTRFGSADRFIRM